MTNGGITYVTGVTGLLLLPLVLLLRVVVGLDTGGVDVIGRGVLVDCNGREVVAGLGVNGNGVEITTELAPPLGTWVVDEILFPLCTLLPAPPEPSLPVHT